MRAAPGNPPHPAAPGDEPYRVILLLRDIEELDTAQTAERLGISAAAVKVRLHRARQALRTLLEPHFALAGAATER